MRSIKNTLTGAGVAALMLAATPFVSFADSAASLPAETGAEQVQTVSTMGAPYFAALLNAGTQQSMMELNAFNARGNGVEVAGVQIDPSGSSQVHTVSTTGSPMFASLLNAGTSYTVAINNGDLTH